MKKLIIAVVFIANVAILASCNRDRCPAHGQAPDVEQVKNV